MRALIVLVVLLIGGITHAQCGSPCEPVKWPLPTWPALASPTPLVPDAAANAPTTATPTPPASTLTPMLDVGDVGNSLATLEHVVAGTMPPLANPSGTPFTLPDLLATAQSDTTDFWGYSKGLGEIGFLGPLSPFAGLLIVFLLSLVLIKGSTFLLPVGFALFGMLRKVIGLLLDFLPF